MKRIVLVVILAAIVLIMSGCVERAKTSVEPGITYAQLTMPDGTIVKGECTYSIRYSGSWVEIYIDGVKYLTNGWRVVIWERR